MRIIATERAPCSPFQWWAQSADDKLNPNYAGSHRFAMGLEELEHILQRSAPTALPRHTADLKEPADRLDELGSVVAHISNS